MRVPRTLEAFRFRNYRLFFIGQLVSIFGSQMQGTAQGYLVYELTDSASYLGLVSFMNTMPSWLFMLLSGVILDHMERRKMMVITQSAMMLVAFGQAALVFTGVVAPWHILGLTFLLGSANAFDTPARQSIPADLVPKSRLGNAIALNSTIFNLAMVVGPTAAGIAYALWGPAWCFLINAISFSAILIALLMMRKETWDEEQPGAVDKAAPAGPATRTGRSMWEDLKTGFRFIGQNRIVLLLLIGVGVISFGFSGLIPLLPAWAVDVLGGDVRTNGWLVSARGAGALVGALLLASVSDRGIRGKLWTLGSFGMPLMMILFSFTRTLALSMAAIIGLGFFFITVMNNTNAMVQTRLPDNIRGRVMSVYSLSLFGGFSLGGLVMGGVAEALGLAATVRISAAVIIAFALLILLFQPKIRALG
ncbi:MAG: MFS transporter [Anaerolineae bacterium]|nr:MFS transporter [Anaerolineae bacterium]